MSELDRIFTEEIVLEKEVKQEKKDILTEKCLSCGSVEIIPMSDFEHNFDDKVEKNNGVLCDECGCFHYLDEDGCVTYEYNYRDILIGSDKVDWKISDN